VISILCPTRGRPQMVERMMRSVRDTQAGDVEIILAFDNDDPSRVRQYEDADEVITGSGTVGEYWNRMATMARGDIIMMGNDDFFYVTPDWDQIVTNAVEHEFPDGIYVAWTDDGSGKAHERCAVPIVSKEWINTLGYFCPAGFRFFYNDTWIAELGRRIGRELYIGNALVEHRHFSFGKMEADETTRRNRIDRTIHQHDTALFASTDEAREIAADLLQDKMDEWKQA